ncbi:hypothetical protein IEQ34_017548 [Dendrobium chrysotoxum]|uniref:Uncharacterized protein n=1 Tax=Dendrobium chrysotoxum TaxID=161865 RepID=A0AAV7FUA7_DENCH|nr:hypothetical protein IEQ34_017548 [Dendrobium chrysotoxum]
MLELLEKAVPHMLIAFSSFTVGNAPSPFLPSTPGMQPMTPNSANYLPGTPVYSITTLSIKNASTINKTH